MRELRESKAFGCIVSILRSTGCRQTYGTGNRTGTYRYSSCGSVSLPSVLDDFRFMHLKT